MRPHALRGLQTPAKEGAQFSILREPPAQGGCAYIRCEACGAELLLNLGGWDKLTHLGDCPHGDSA